METKNTPAEHAGKKDFDAVKYMREQRDRISKDIMNLSPEEIVKYFEKNEEKRAQIPVLKSLFNDNQEFYD